MAARDVDVPPHPLQWISFGESARTTNRGQNIDGSRKTLTEYPIDPRMPARIESSISFSAVAKFST
jgi:hypothetical protein